MLGRKDVTMWGIVWEDVRRVRLVRPNHPDVVAHQRRQASWTTMRYDAKFHEREQERQLITRRTARAMVARAAGLEYGPRHRCPDHAVSRARGAATDGRVG
jgi:hypothetical protein